GADDYMTKPFGLREFLARVRLRLRASSAHAASFRIGDVDVDLEAYELSRDGDRQALSEKEASMLALLWRERGKVVRRERFLAAIWGTRFVTSRTIDTHVFNLRKKLELDPRNPQHLMTVHGIGYRLDV
ncbi:MAG: response regulator transcription factor, partial [Planctomycetes bacterium]|nr:response regulator transcription factor [Planctomycetota bacterium]